MNPIICLVLSGLLHDLPPTIDSFHYQLQDLDLAQAAASPYPLIVTDYSLDGSAPTELTPADVALLKSSGRIALAYMSIGEAEDYRFYWDPAWSDGGKNDPDRPAWLGPANPDFGGNFEVRYWDPSWQALIFGSPGAYLDRILAQGFDGVYLDIVDGFEYWGPDGTGERPQAAADMIAFVEAIAAYARHTDPDFHVVPQNGSALVANAGFLAAISGIGVEDTWFNGNRKQKPSQAREVVPDLETVRGAGKAVLMIDYPSSRPLIDAFFDRAEAKGFGAHNSDRSLDRLTVHAEHPPSPGPTIALLSPADGAAAGRSAPPTLTWSSAGGVRFEIHYSGSGDLVKVKTLKTKGGPITGSSYTPSSKEWSKIGGAAPGGAGAVLRWWIVAVDASGARRSAPLSTLVFGD